jgi:hypothetical protein
MKAIDSRIRRLQGRLCPDGGQEQRLWVTTLIGRELALDSDRCVDILGECGFLPAGRFGIVSLCGIPDGLNAKELEKYLRTYGTQAPGFGLGRQESMPSGMGRLGNSSWPNQAQMASDGT